jgi:hypothetical protein
VSHIVWEGNIFWENTNRGDYKKTTTTTKNLWLERFLKSSRITCVARIVELVEVVDGYIDHGHVILLLGTPLSLPDVSPSDDDDQLGGQEQSSSNDEAERVDATTARQLLFDENFSQ